MMKVFLGSILSLFLLTAATRQSEHEYIAHNSFSKGETLEYKATFGIFTVGKGSMKVNNNLYRVNGRDCYKVDVYGKTVGMVAWVADVDDYWGSYVDTTSLVSHIALRKLKEGRYKKNEIMKFDHVSNMIEVKDYNHDEGKFREPKYYMHEDKYRDMIAGFFWMRTLDFDTLQKLDTITVKSFIEDTFYDFQVVCKGREVLETKAGSFNAIKFEPVMPDNSIFDGEDSILAWFSDDDNKIPLKVQAKMFIGKAGIELLEYNGLRNPPSLVED